MIRSTDAGPYPKGHLHFAPDISTDNENSVFVLVDATSLIDKSEPLCKTLDSISLSNKAQSLLKY